MDILDTMSNIVSRATVYERHTPHTEFFTDTSGKIEYVLNSFWHREQELSEFNSGYTLALGCSHTFGIGVSNPWPSYFENIYNAGVPGATIYDMVDIAMGMHKEKPFEKIMLFVPHAERFIVFKNKKQYALMPYADVFEEFKNIDLDTKMFYNKRSMDFLSLWCENNNVVLESVTASSIQFLKEHKDSIVDKATDNLHYGEKTHKNFAGLFNA